MEIGSFLELQFPKGMEYYGGETDVARLNTGRAAIYHALRASGCKTIWLPYYQCDSVREFLRRKRCGIKYYAVNERLEPVRLSPGEDEAVLLVNYFGVMSDRRMRALAAKYAHPILDCCQAFFAPPVPGALSVYSARKFVGVPDGAYVVGKGAHCGCGDYAQGYSSDTAGFLLERIEYGCEGRGYAARAINENRIDHEDVMRMSKLTRTILDGTDYAFIMRRRRENYAYAAERFGGCNRATMLGSYDETCVPMVYPLVIEREGVLETLLAHKHFQGHWWSYLAEELPAETVESRLSRFLIPITIDQRYGREEIDYLRSLI